MSDKAAAMLTPKAQHPERTKTFVSAIADALELFEDHIGSLDEDIRTNAYATLLTSYRDTDVEIILKMITDKELTSLKDMASTFSEKGDQLQKRDIIFLFDIWCSNFFFDL